MAGGGSSRRGASSGALAESGEAAEQYPGAIESRLESVGRDLSFAKHHRDAIDVLELNARHFPRSWNAYAALAEAYAASGDTGLAIRNYEKSLALNPKNDAGKVALAKLRGRRSP